MAKITRAFNVYVVLCTKTGGRFVTVRSCSESGLWSLLRAGTKDPNFNMPILLSFRKYGENAHSISLHSTYSTRRQANLMKKELVEKQAISKPEFNLNYNRPVKYMPDSDFRWLTEEEVAAKVKAKRAARKAKATTKEMVVQTSTVEAQATV